MYLIFHVATKINRYIVPFSVLIKYQLNRVLYMLQVTVEIMLGERRIISGYQDVLLKNLICIVAVTVKNYS